MSRTLLFGAFVFAGTIVLSSCSGSSVPQSGALPQVKEQSVLRGATAPSVTITEYPVLINPHSPIIGPDGAVWFAQRSGPGNGSSPLFVYRFAANDGQGRFYALPSLLNSLPEALKPVQWTQEGPIVSFAGRVWISFNTSVDASVYQDIAMFSGLIQMTATGTALNATRMYDNYEIGAATVQGTKLWVMAQQNNGPGDPGLRSFTAANDGLHDALMRWPTPYLFLSPALRAGPDGNIYVLTIEERGSPPFTGVTKVSSIANKILARYQLNNFQPVDMAFGSDGALWITTSFQYTSGMPYIVRMTTNGTRALYKIPYPGASPTAITLGRDGAMWFIDAGTNAIGRITISGAVTEHPVPTRNAFAATAGSAGGIVACPVSVAACGSGDIWFTEPNTSRLGRIHINP